MDLSTLILFSVTLMGCFDLGVESVDLAVDLRLTKEQKVIMDKFRNIIKSKVPHRYMLEEIYLVRWLRAKNFNLQKTEKFLLDNLRWRKQQRMDTIQQENFDDIKDDFPYSLGSHFDKRGQPIVSAIARDWDLRQAVVTGRYKRALKYLDKSMEEATTMLRKMQLEGKNVTQFVIIIHMGHFNLFQHGCGKCITGILEFIDSYENHYPGFADKILLVQTPPAFEAIAHLVREGSSPSTRDAMKIYGMQPKVWKKALLDFIDPNQIPEELQ